MCSGFKAIPNAPYFLHRIMLGIALPSFSSYQYCTQYDQFNMKTILVALSLLFAPALVFAQADNEATLVFTRTWEGAGDNYASRIFINGEESCVLDSDSDKIVSCTKKVKAGEVSIKVTSARGSDFLYVIDVQKSKTYTIVVYVRNLQTTDLIWSTMSKKLIKNKAPESQDYNRMSFKTQVIAID